MIAACGRDELAKKEADIAAREEKLRVGQKVLREEEKKFFDEKDNLREQEMGLRQAAFKLREGETLFRMQLDAFNAHQTLLQSRSGVDSPKPFDTTYTSHVPSEFAKGLSLSTSNLVTQSPSSFQAGSQSASKSGQVPQVLFAGSPGGRSLRAASPSNGASRGESPSGGATDHPDSRRRLSMSASDMDRGASSALERGRGSPMNLSSFMNRLDVQTGGGATSTSLGKKDPPPQLTSVMSHASDFELHWPLPTSYPSERVGSSGMYPSERVGSGGFAAGLQQSSTPGRSHGPLKATSLEEDEVLV